jgi:hypothetical protein
VCVCVCVAVHHQAVETVGLCVHMSHQPLQSQPDAPVATPPSGVIQNAKILPDISSVITLDTLHCLQLQCSMLQG